MSHIPFIAPGESEETEIQRERQSEKIERRLKEEKKITTKTIRAETTRTETMKGTKVQTLGAI